MTKPSTPDSTRPVRAGAILSDRSIREEIEAQRLLIAPYDELMVQPASYDMNLGRTFRVFHNHKAAAIDLKDPPMVTESIEVPQDGSFVVHPGEFVLGRTEEVIGLPDNLVARVEGKSSIGRLGLIIHATAGFVDPGFTGSITLEMTNLTRIPIIIYPGMPIAQLSFMWLDQPAERPYGHPELGSHYQGQIDATESRYEGGPGQERTR